MTRLKRSDLKALVKECLLEIITEDFITKSIQEKLIEVVAMSTSAAVQPQSRIVNENYYTKTIPTQPNVAQQHVNKEQNDLNERMNKFKQTLNNVYSPPPPQPAPIDRAEQLGKVAANVLGVKDNIMRSIFEDTAKTTVQEQVEGPGRSNPTNPGLDISGIINPAWAKMAGL